MKKIAVTLLSFLLGGITVVAFAMRKLINDFDNTEWEEEYDALLAAALCPDEVEGSSRRARFNEDDFNPWDDDPLDMLTVVTGPDVEDEDDEWEDRHQYNHPYDDNEPF